MNSIAIKYLLNQRQAANSHENRRSNFPVTDTRVHTFDEFQI